MNTALLALLSLVSLQAADLRVFEAVEPHMGTLFRIKLYAADEEQARAAFRSAFDRVTQLDAALSDYKPDSELNRLCRAPAGRPVPVSEDLYRVVAASQDLARESDGAFDVTQGPIIRLWREARRSRQLPNPDQLQAARSRCGYQKLRLDTGSRTITLDRADMLLDVGGIAKGDAADQALAVLRRLGIRSALVAASGDLAFGDPPPGARGWKIGVDALDRPEAGFTSTLLLSNAAISTSGDSEQGVEIEGKRYSHIIDPATGMALSTPITVTIVARRGIDADGLATAVSVLGLDRGMQLIERRAGVAASITLTGNGAARTVKSRGWSRLGR